MMGQYRIYVNGHLRRITDDEEVAKRIEERAIWNGRQVDRYGRNYYIGKRY